MRMNYLRVDAEAMGYGRMGLNIERSLRRSGVDVFTSLPSPEEITPEDSICANAVWMSVPTHARGWWEGQKLHILTMWEATVLPESFRESIHEFETVMVPSQQNVELFSKYHDNVKLVTLGIDPEVWHPIKRPEPSVYFDFLIGGSGTRKGTDLAYKAFLKVFATWPKGGPVPRLVMKSPRGAEFSGERVEVISGRISAEEEVDLYSGAHCYLQPSRGEGFGLQPLQAIAQGLPTILTGAHGHASFSHLGMELSSKMEPAAYFMYGDAGEWWEPDFDELCERMEWVYHNYEDAVCDAAVAADIAVSTFNWDASTNQLLDAIGRERFELPDVVPNEWVKPKLKRFLTVVDRDWICNMAGVDYHFKRGEEYWETADVKRILFEGGFLDPRCIVAMTIDGVSVESGLLESQLERVGDYSASHAYCPTCNQKLNTQPNKFDAILESL
jgi:hypothetical protein